METFIICLVFLLAIMAGMSIGLLKGRRVSGSCGGATGVCSVCGKDNAKDRLAQMKKDPNRRIDSDNMTEVEKMDAGFTHGTYNINGRDVDFQEIKMAITKANEIKKTPQILTHPKLFEVQRWFGPHTSTVMLPDDVLQALIKMSDKLIDDEKTLEHGSSLAGVINKELKVYKSDLEDFGVLNILESCVRTYVTEVSKSRSTIAKDATINSNINSCWTVSQYANEYNPIHNHTGCEISAVLYLKVPDLKGRRNIPNKKNKPDHDGDINFAYNAASERPLDIFDKGLIQFTPSPGVLLMFPSYLLHTVYPFIGEGERRSLAFNANYQIFNPFPDGTHELVAGSQAGVQFQKSFFEKEKNNGNNTK